MSPRATYLSAVVVSALIITFAWVARDRFTPLGPGAEAPEFVYPDLTGLPVSLADHEGKVVMLNIWATWCAPCRVEMPSMERLYKAMEGRPFEILAVSIDAPSGMMDPSGRPGGDLASFADSLGLTFPILHDPSGRIQATYQTTGVPETFLIGKDGRIYRKVIGAMEWDTPTAIAQVERLVDG